MHACARLPLLSAALATMLLSGCAATPAPRTEIQHVSVAIPVACQEPEPARPQMPTDALPDDAGVDAYVQAAAAEIERREGYEAQLLTALHNCKRPLPVDATKN